MVEPRVEISEISAKVIYHTIIVVKMVSTKKTANTIPKNVSAVLIHIYRYRYCMSSHMPPAKPLRLVAASFSKSVTSSWLIPSVGEFATKCSIFMM